MRKIRLGQLFKEARGGWFAIFQFASFFGGILLGVTALYGLRIANGQGPDFLYSSSLGWMLMAFLVPPFGYIFGAIVMAVCLYESYSLCRQGGVLASFILFGAGTLILSRMWLGSPVLIAIGVYVGRTAYLKMPRPEPVGEISFVREFPKPKN